MNLGLFIPLYSVIIFIAYIIFNYKHTKKDIPVATDWHYFIVTIYRNGKYETIPIEGNSDCVITFIMVEKQLGRDVQIIFVKCVNSETFTKFSKLYNNN